MSEIDLQRTCNGIAEFSAVNIKQPEPLLGIAALAERLGVREGENLGQVDIDVGDGRRYSLVSIVNAVLDKLENSVPADEEQS